MTQSEEPLEALLLAIYEEEARCYREALRLAQRLPEHLRQGQDTSGCLQEVFAVLDRVAGEETRLAPLKQRWLDSGQRAGPALRRLLDELAGLIAQVVQHIQAAETETAARRDRLGPQLDDGVRARRMRQAYGQGR